MATISLPTTATAEQKEYERLSLTVRVVLVDDSPEFLQTLCDLLQPFRSVHVVGTASDGAEALALMATALPDLLIMNVNMPVFDGVETAALLSDWYPFTKILLMSDDAGEDMQERCRKSKAHGFVAKGELVEKLRRFCA